jgi:hypothetical protein
LNHIGERTKFLRGRRLEHHVVAVLLDQDFGRWSAGRLRFKFIGIA